MILYTTLSYNNIIIVYILFVDWNDKIYIISYILFVDWNDKYIRWLEWRILKRGGKWELGSTVIDNMIYYILILYLAYLDNDLTNFNDIL